jgi:hypothetical protein
LTDEERSELESVVHGYGIEYWAGVYLENPGKAGIALYAHIVLLGDTRTPAEVSDELFRRNVRVYSRGNVAELLDRFNQRRQTVETVVERLTRAGADSWQPEPVEQVEPKSSARRAPKAPCNVSINWAGNGPKSAVIVDGKTFMVSLEGAVVVDILTRKAPATITYLQMTQISHTLRDHTPSKIGREIISKLPDEIRAHINTKPGSGCTWIS